MNRNLDGHNRITLPAEILNQLNIKNNDEVKIELKGNAIYISKAIDQFEEYLNELYENNPDDLIKIIYMKYVELTK